MNFLETWQSNCLLLTTNRHSGSSKWDWSSGSMSRNTLRHPRAGCAGELKALGLGSPGMAAVSLTIKRTIQVMIGRQRLMPSDVDGRSGVRVNPSGSKSEPVRPPLGTPLPQGSWFVSSSGKTDIRDERANLC